MKVYAGICRPVRTTGGQDRRSRRFGASKSWGAGSSQEEERPPFAGRRVSIWTPLPVAIPPSGVALPPRPGLPARADPPDPDTWSYKMPTIADHIRAHLEATGKSMRALSLEAGFSEGWVKDVLRGASKRPGAEALARMSAIIGVDLRDPERTRGERSGCAAAPGRRAARRVEPLAGQGREDGDQVLRRTERRGWTRHDLARASARARLAAIHHGRNPRARGEHVRRVCEPPEEGDRSGPRHPETAPDPGRARVVAGPLRRGQSCRPPRLRRSFLRTLLLMVPLLGTRNRRRLS
jgi:lambda repressor-like predicted transcriptional regulator